MQISMTEAMILPLPFERQRLWFVEQWQPGTPVLNSGRTVELNGGPSAGLGRALPRICSDALELESVNFDFFSSPG